MKSMEENRERYEAAAHAMQTGVAYEMSTSPAAAAASPKHLRVGVNAAMSDQAGLAELLIRKGLITKEEYCEAVADSMEKERQRYQDRMPANVTLA
jgi:hypothetical protein